MLVQSKKKHSISHSIQVNGTALDLRQLIMLKQSVTTVKTLRQSVTTVKTNLNDGSYEQFTQKTQAVKQKIQNIETPKSPKSFKFPKSKSQSPTTTFDSSNVQQAIVELKNVINAKTTAYQELETKYR